MFRRSEVESEKGGRANVIKKMATRMSLRFKDKKMLLRDMISAKACDDGISTTTNSKSRMKSEFCSAIATEVASEVHTTKTGMSDHIWNVGGFATYSFPLDMKSELSHISYLDFGFSVISDTPPWTQIRLFFNQDHTEHRDDIVLYADVIAHDRTHESCQKTVTKCNRVLISSRIPRSISIISPQRAMVDPPCDIGFIEAAILEIDGHTFISSEYPREHVVLKKRKIYTSIGWLCISE